MYYVIIHIVKIQVLSEFKFHNVQILARLFKLIPLYTFIINFLHNSEVHN